jgi:hypothetical protein
MWDCSSISFRATDYSICPNGAAIHPAQGNALGNGETNRIAWRPNGPTVLQGEWLARWADESISHTRFPGRCPGLGERRGLRPLRHLVCGTITDTRNTRIYFGKQCSSWRLTLRPLTLDGSSVCRFSISKDSRPTCASARHLKCAAGPFVGRIPQTLDIRPYHGETVARCHACCSARIAAQTDGGVAGSAADFSIIGLR